MFSKKTFLLNVNLSEDVMERVTNNLVPVEYEMSNSDCIIYNGNQIC